MVSNWYRWCINLYYRIVNTLKRTPTKNVTATKYSAQDIQADSLEGVKGAVSEEFRRIQAALNVKPGDNIVTSPTTDTGSGTGEATSTAPNSLSGITVYFNNTTMPFLKKVQALTFANKVTNNSYGVNVYPVNFVLSGDDKTDYKQSNDGQIVKVQAKVAIPLSDLKPTPVFSNHKFSRTNLATTGEAVFSNYFMGNGGIGGGVFFKYTDELYDGLPFDTQSSEAKWEVTPSKPLYLTNNYDIYQKITVPEDGVYQVDAFYQCFFGCKVWTDFGTIPEDEQLYRAYPDYIDGIPYVYQMVVERGSQNIYTILDTRHLVPSLAKDVETTVGITYNNLILTLGRTVEFNFKQGDKVHFRIDPIAAAAGGVYDELWLYIQQYNILGQLQHEVSFTKIKDYEEITQFDVVEV